MLQDHCHILYVDDEYNNIVVFEGSFFKDFEIHTATSGLEALAILEEQEIHVLITDQRMPGMNGLELLEIVSEKFPDVIKVILTAYSDIEVIMQAINKCQIFQYILKPWDRRNLKMVIENAWARFNLRAENEKLIKDLQHINAGLEAKVKERTLQLQEKNEALSEHNAFKDRLFSIISHDLKTPLLSLEVYLDMLNHYQDKLSTEKIHVYSKKIRLYLSELQDLLDSILQWSLPNNADFNGPMNGIDIHECIKNNISLYKAAAEQKGLTIQYQEPSKPLYVLGNVNMMNVILRNLISNAVKYSRRKDNITITLKHNGSGTEITITDSGVGIDKKVLPDLFSNSKYITTKGTALENGTGLGLKLCRELVEKQLGKIAVESKKGVGTTFKISFPDSRELKDQA